jgi:hypothetical protein|tara:strand:+ start:174 stop:359 length:186 start_codon:yes stop_codon:yes gene_type:complete
MPNEVTEHIDLLNKLAELAIIKDELWSYHPDNPNQRNIKQEYEIICAKIAGLEGELASLHS